MFHGKGRGDFHFFDGFTQAGNHGLEIVGEEAKLVPAEVRDRAPEIPWHVMAGMRDKLIHAYAGVDLQVVWRTVHEELPSVVAQLEALLAEFESS